ncbi:MAG: hypothetical protein ACFFE6_07615 [Candidatus Thorarchaeota archaeon]
MKERRVRLYAVAVMLCLLFIGSTTLPVVNATVDLDLTLDGSVGNEQGFVSEWFYLYEGQEVEVILTPDGVCDLDLYVDSQYEWDIAYAETPAGEETVYFIAPYDAYYNLYVYGWWVPGESVDFTITVRAGDDVFPEFPAIRITPTDNTYGNIKGWTKSHTIAINRASWNSAIKVWPTAYENNIVWLFLPPPAQRPLKQFCAEDALLVGAYAYGWFIDETSPPDEVIREFLGGITVEHFIDGDPLSSLTKIQSGPIRPHYVNGVLARYYFRTDCGAFKPGELEEAIGLGEHKIETIATFPDGSIDYFVNYFELVSLL